jgi:hypothetical protein
MLPVPVPVHVLRTRVSPLTPALSCVCVCVCVRMCVATWAAVVVENQSALLAELPSAALYERSYMHRDQLLQVVVTKYARKRQRKREGCDQGRPAGAHRKREDRRTAPPLPPLVCPYSLCWAGRTLL